MDPCVAGTPEPERGHPPIVLLCGWGMRAAVMQPLADALGARAVLAPPLAGEPGGRRARLHAWLNEQLAPRSVIVGWSLGASIAIDFAAAHPTRVAALVTIAGNPCFCARPDWPTGVPEELFGRFAAALGADTQALLGRFAALQAQGDARERQVLRALRAALTDPHDPVALRSGLEMLQRWDLRAALARLRVPTLHVLGAADRLVPANLEYELQRLQPEASVWVASGAAHAPFLSRPEATAARIADFLAALRPAAVAPAKREVARSFSRAAVGYDAAASVQQLSGEALLERAPAGLAPRLALDLGCGTGARLARLEARFPAAAWVSADLAEGMLQRLRERDAQARAVGADAERLPFAPGSFGLVYSNLVLQWSAAPGTVFAELARVLCPGGVAMLGTLGPDTLWELRSAWRAVDAGAHVHNFDPPARLREAARAAGLLVEQFATQRLTARHAGVGGIARELRSIGAHNLDPRRAQGLTGRRRWQRLGERYALLGDGEPGLPATWQLVQLVLRKPHA